jgi:hypothetical protein
MNTPPKRNNSLRNDIEAAFEARGDDENFERALGRFIIAFADAESELHKVLVQYSQVTDPISRALFSGTRAKGMIDFIRSIAHNSAMSADRRDDLEHVFVQFAAINTMRDHIVHHASDSYSCDDPKKRIVANTRASRYGNAKGYEIGTDTIDTMTWDLYGISNHLNMHWGPRQGPFRPWRENPEDDGPTAWAYKSLDPIPPWEKTPSNKQLPKR